MKAGARSPVCHAATVPLAPGRAGGRRPQWQPAGPGTLVAAVCADSEGLCASQSDGGHGAAASATRRVMPGKPRPASATASLSCTHSLPVCAAQAARGH